MAGAAGTTRVPPPLPPFRPLIPRPLASRGGRARLAGTTLGNERMPTDRQSGFTLIELMIAVAVLAILLAMALPSFQQSMRSNRVATTTNEMLASLALARSEAIRGTRGGGVCASTAGTACDGTQWGDGWMIWIDVGNAGIGTFEATDTVVRFSQPKSKTEVGAGSATAFSFDNRGRMSARNSGGSLLPGGALNIEVRPDTCPSGQELVRNLTVTPVGQVRVQRSNCT